jgi:gluconolactonase
MVAAVRGSASRVLSWGVRSAVVVVAAASAQVAALGCASSGATAPGATAPASATSTPLATPSALPSFCAGQDLTAAPVAPEVQAELVRDGFVFVEGPVWVDSQQAFFFSEMDFGHQGKNGPPSTIHRLALPSSLEVYIKEGGSNGLAADATGLVACTHDTQTLSHYDFASKQRTTLVADYQGRHFNSPNDVALHSAGHIYFTDPDWQLAERPNETGVTAFYMKMASGQITQWGADMKKPNGVTLSPDETHLYVGHLGEIRVFPVLADGTLGAGERFAEVAEPDGMSVDCAGNLYVASHNEGQVNVYNSQGQRISVIRVAPQTTNVAFGGPDRRTLLVTSGHGVYQLHSNVPGMPN